MLCHSLLAFRISVEKLADNLMGVSLYVICCFSLVAFNILPLIVIILITRCLGLFLLGIIPPGTLCASWTWLTISFPTLGKFSASMSSPIFSGPFSLFSPSGTPIMWMLENLTLSQRSLRLFFFPFHSFFYILSVTVISTILSSRSLNHSASVIQLLIISSVLLISVYLFLSS